MLGNGGKSGLGGTRDIGGGETRVAEVKAIRVAPGGSDRRVDISMKKETGMGYEKASVYMSRKNAKEVKSHKKYEFDLEKSAFNKERGQGNSRINKERKTFRCENPPREIGVEKVDLNRFGGSGGGRGGGGSKGGGGKMGRF